MARILVVDDEYQIRTFVAAMLRRAGYEVNTADNGLGAVKMSGGSPSYDLVLSDVAMPILDGHELARWFAVNRQDCKVILMSAADTGCESCPFMPRCQILRKPFSRQDLLSMVTATLQSSGRMFV